MASKQAVFAQIKEAHEIAERLYKSDRELYKPLFAWINAQIKRRVSPGLVLEVVKAIERQHQSGNKPRDIREYVGGIARSIKEHKAGRDLRAGQTNWISEILGKAMAAAQNPTSPPRCGGENKRGK